MTWLNGFAFFQDNLAGFLGCVLGMLALVLAGIVLFLFLARVVEERCYERPAVERTSPLIVVVLVNTSSQGAMKDLLWSELRRPIPAVVLIVVTVWGLACHVVTGLLFRVFGT